uniref:Uncharacterized protein n=1 Tax=Rhizophora mucronata TaxID=61149 RepID=A0A2P2NMY9_RHIMU
MRPIIHCNNPTQSGFRIYPVLSMSWGTCHRPHRIQGRHPLSR